MRCGGSWQTAQAEQLEIERKSQKQRSAKRPKAGPKPDTPEAVEGRKHIDVQTEQYLEELTDRPVEAEVDTQAVHDAIGTRAALRRDGVCPARPRSSVAFMSLPPCPASLPAPPPAPDTTPRYSREAKCGR